MEFSLWESLLLGVMVLGIIFWMRPGIKLSMQQSKNAKSDWIGLLVPIGFVIIFIVFLVSMV
jgi:TRAP-type C4-dicarboxylate transport system permease small subunit